MSVHAIDDMVDYIIITLLFFGIQFVHILLSLFFIGPPCWSHIAVDWPMGQDATAFC